MDRLTTRRAAPEDVPALLDLWAGSAENASRPADRADLVARLIQHDPDAVLVAEVEGQVVASIIAGWDGWRAHLYRLAVRADLRGRGVGALLIRLAEDRLTGLGAERVDAMVLDENTLGQGAWQRAGFVRQADWSRWVKTVV